MQVRWGYVFNNNADLKTGDLGGGIGIDRERLNGAGAGDWYENYGINAPGYNALGALTKSKKYNVKIFGRDVNATRHKSPASMLHVSWNTTELNDCIEGGAKVLSAEKKCNGATTGWKEACTASAGEESCLTNVPYSKDSKYVFKVSQMCENDYAASVPSDATEEYAAVSVSFDVSGNGLSCAWDNLDGIFSTAEQLVSKTLAASVDISAAKLANVIDPKKNDYGTLKPCPKPLRATPTAGFNLVYRQKGGALFPVSAWKKGLNAYYPSKNYFSRLDDLESTFRQEDGKFHFKMIWFDAHGKALYTNEWKQV